MSPEVQHGKTAILEHLKELMKTSSLDPEGLVFRWEENFDRAQRNLNIFKGKEEPPTPFPGGGRGGVGADPRGYG